MRLLGWLAYSAAAACMNKKKFLFLCYFFLHSSMSYSSVPTNPDGLDSSKISPLGLLLDSIRTSYNLPHHELPAIDHETSVRTTHAVEETESLYKRAKYGHPGALATLKEKAETSAHACVLMVKYYKKKATAEDLKTSDIEIYRNKFISLLSQKFTNMKEFQDVKDPFLNLSLAIYHQMGKTEHELAAQYAQAAIKQGCIDGYNVIGKLNKKGDPRKALAYYFKAAEYGSPSGIYNLARSCYNSDKKIFMMWSLYERAAMEGISKAYFILGKQKKREGEKVESIRYFSKLIGIDPYAFIYKGQKKGFGRIVFCVAEQLFKKAPSLLPPLLKSIYDNSSSKKKEVAHVLASSYSFGFNGFPQSHDDALYWLKISAIEHGNLEDAYRLCCLSTADLRGEKTMMELIDLCRHLVNSQEILEKYGANTQILLARFLVEAGVSEDNPGHFEEAMGLVLKTLNNMETDSPRRERTVWRIPGAPDQGKFLTVASAFEGIVKTSGPLQKRVALRALGFHHLGGGAEGRISLENALRCFVGSTSSADRFFAMIINHHLKGQEIKHSLRNHSGHPFALVPFQSVLEDPPSDDEAGATHLEVERLLDHLSDLNTQERTLLKRKIRELSCTDFEGAALFLSECFQKGLFGLSKSTEHEIYWLKLAAEKGCMIAQGILKDRYPLVLSLADEEETILHHLRTHTANQPDFVIVGGGLSGVMTALSLAKARAEEKIKIGKIKIIEEKGNILTGASMIVARQHRGGEYTQDSTTAVQCLYGSVLWEQMFKTKRMLTTEEINDFLLAKASRDGNALSEEALKAHHAFLDARYQQYLNQFDDRVKAQELLFGASPIFHELTEEELRNMGLSHHFAAGIRTTERGFQPVGVGVVLEHLLRLHNVEVITGYEVSNIKPLPRGGFEINGRGQQALYTRFLINAAWHNNSHLAWLVNRSQTRTSPVPSCTKRVFLRCLALVDISQCSLPAGNHNFFGLVSEYGGMVSFFNNRTAAVFVPKDEHSYQGEYDLNAEAVNELPYAAKKRLTLLAGVEKMEVAKRILNDAKIKYPFLENAVVRDLHTQTVVSESREIFERTHSPAKWLRGVDGCLQVCAMKATFAPFVALEALARFVADKPELQANFSKQEARFLKGLIHSDMFKEGTVGNAVLPDCFRLILDDGFMSKEQFHAAMRRYAFERGLDFALFEETADAAAAGMDPSLQFNLISQEEGLKEVDLEHHKLTAELATSLFSLLKRTDIKLQKIKLGPLAEEANDDERDELGKHTLTKLLTADHLTNLTVRGWSFSFSSRYEPLGALLPKLQEMHLKEVTLTLQSVRALFGSGVSFGLLKRLSIVQSHPKKAALKVLMSGIQRCENLEFLDLSGNDIRQALLNETDNELQQLVKQTKRLKYLSLNNNDLFEGVNLMLTNLVTLPLELEASPFLLAITGHPLLEKVDISDNGPASSTLQDRLDSHFARRMEVALY